MKIHFVFSSPEGDIPVSEDILQRPFLLQPSIPHPNLTLGDYFTAIKHFIWEQNRQWFLRILGLGVEDPVRQEAVDRIQIRSEKHGALYHLASVEVFYKGWTRKFVVSSALTDKAKDILNAEVAVLKRLNQSVDPSYLPEIYFLDEIRLRPGLSEASMLMALGQWFEGFHEWHLSRDETGQTAVQIWDLENGCRFASDQEQYGIYREASRILTRYYDTQKMTQIYPWHHAAGDFIVKATGKHVELRLTTARAYEPIYAFLKTEDIKPIIGLVYFFLNLTVKMRLDKLDGTGDVAWAGPFSADAVVEGFFEAVQEKAHRERYDLGELNDLGAVLKSFNQDEMKKLFDPLLNRYVEEDPEDYAIIRQNLPAHIKTLQKAMRKFPS
jgi:hypothetical protein